MNSLKAQLTKISQCMAMGKYNDAQSLLNVYKQVLVQYYDQDHPAYCSYENNQGLLWRLNTQFKEAYDIFSSVYNKYMKMFGINHPSTISVCINLATVLRDLEDYEQSISYYEKAIQARKTIEGDSSPNYALVLGMCAGAYRLNNDTDTAYRYLKESYGILASHYSTEECVPCAVVLNSMGLLYKQRNQLDRAADAYERCLVVREKLLGPKHPETIAVRHNLGDLYMTWEKTDKGREMLELNVKYMDELKEEQEREANEKIDTHVDERQSSAFKAPSGHVYSYPRPSGGKE